jgi:hypothetical protein
MQADSGTPICQICLFSMNRTERAPAEGGCTRDQSQEKGTPKQPRSRKGGLAWVGITYVLSFDGSTGTSFHSIVSGRRLLSVYLLCRV